MQESEPHSPPEAGMEGERDLRWLAGRAECEECVRSRRRVKYLSMLVISLCFGITAQSVLVLWTFSSSNRLVHSIQKLAEAQRAQSFASGFVYGQRSVLRHAGLSVGMFPVPEFSKEDRANASKHGFDSDDDNPER